VRAAARPPGRQEPLSRKSAVRRIPDRQIHPFRGTLAFQYEIAGALEGNLPAFWFAELGVFARSGDRPIRQAGGGFRGCLFSRGPVRSRVLRRALRRCRVLAGIRRGRWRPHLVRPTRLSGTRLGVVIGTVVANLLSDRQLLTSLLKGLCNAGEAVLINWLLERWFGRSFAFSDIRQVFGFLAAATAAAAVSAVGGATIMTALHTTAPFWEVWNAWLLSDGVGIVVVAPPWSFGLARRGASHRRAAR
jgi:MASE1